MGGIAVVFKVWGATRNFAHSLEDIRTNNPNFYLVKSEMLYFQDCISYSNEPRNRKKVGFLVTGLAKEKFG